MYKSKYGAPPGAQDSINGNFNSSKVDQGSGRLKMAVESGKKLLIGTLLGSLLISCAPKPKTSFDYQGKNEENPKLTDIVKNENTIYQLLEALEKEKQDSKVSIHDLLSAFVKDKETTKENKESEKNDISRFSLKLGNNQNFVQEKGKQYQKHSDFVKSIYNKGVLKNYPLRNISEDMFINLAVIESYLTKEIQGGRCFGYYQVDIQTEKFIQREIIAKDPDLQSFIKKFPKSLNNSEYNTIIAYLYLRHLQETNPDPFVDENLKNTFQENVLKNLPYIFKKVSKKLAGKGMTLDKGKFEYLMKFLINDSNFLKAIADLNTYNGQKVENWVHMDKEFKFYSLFITFAAAVNGDVYIVFYNKDGEDKSAIKIS